MRIYNLTYDVLFISLQFKALSVTDNESNQKLAAAGGLIVNQGSIPPGGGIESSTTNGESGETNPFAQAEEDIKSEYSLGGVGFNQGFNSLNAIQQRTSDFNQKKSSF